MENRDRVLLASVDNEKSSVESWRIFSDRLYPIEKYCVSFEDTIGYTIEYGQLWGTKMEEISEEDVLRKHLLSWRSTADASCRKQKTIKKLKRGILERISSIFL